MRWLGLVVVLAGCDKLFSLEHVDPAADDARVVDTRSIDTLVDVSPDAVEPCPTGYGPVANAPNRYRMSTGMQTWDSAAADCSNDTVTHVTHLVVIDTAAEMAALRPFVNMPPPWMVFVGFARDTIAQGGDPTKFTSVTSIPLPYDSPLWATGEPDNNLGPPPEETVVFFRNDKDLTDGPPSVVSLPYICECDGIPANQVFHTVN